MRRATLPRVNTADDPLKPLRDAAALTAKARRLQRQVDAVNARRREIIAELIRLGLNQREIARHLDLSPQRVSQYVAELRADGTLPPEQG